MIGAEGGSRTRTTLRSTDFKPVARLLTAFYYALPNSIYRRFSRQSKLRPTWYRYVTPSSSPHPNPGAFALISPHLLECAHTGPLLDHGRALLCAPESRSAQ